MKKIIILLLCAVLLLCGCVSEQPAEDNGDRGNSGTSEKGGSQLPDDDIIPEKDIRTDVMTFFELDSSDEKSVAHLFMDLDKAYEKAVNSSKADQDYLDYAKQVKQILDASDATFDWDIWDRKYSPDATLSLEDATAGYNIGHQYIAVITYSDSLEGVENAENAESGYSYAAVALALADAYNDFFYGGNRYTEDAHNALLSNSQ